MHISTVQSWRPLVSQLKKVPALQFMQDLPEEYLRIKLMPVVALAYWLDKTHPKCLEKRSVKLAVIGANVLDMANEGRWYGVLGHLLSRPDLRLSIDLIGYEVDEQTPLDGEFSHLESQVGQWLPNISTIYHCSLDDYLNQIDSMPNLGVMFHPSFETDHDEWFSDNGLAKWVSHHIPTCVSAYFSDAAYIDSLWLRAYGFEGKLKVRRNPFAIGFGKNTFFAHTLYTLPRSVQTPLCIRDQRLIHKASKVSDVIEEAYLVDYSAFFKELFSSVAAQMPDGSLLTLLQLPFNFYLDSHNGEILIQEEEGAFLKSELGQISDSLLSSIPSSDADEATKLDWLGDLLLEQPLISPSYYRSLYEKLDYLKAASPNLADASLNNMITSRESQSFVSALRTALDENGYAGTEGVGFDAKVFQAMHDLMPKETIQLNELESEFIASAVNGDIAHAISLMTEHPGLLRTANPLGQHIGFYAAAEGHLTLLDSFLNLGGDAKTVDKHGWTLLMHAIRSNQSDIVEYLLAHPASRETLSFKNSMDMSANDIAELLGLADISSALQAA